MGISVVVITKNEEDNIKECLENIKWADEIIIVDANSEDRTVELARTFTDKIFIREWNGFSNQKNFGIEKVSSEWVLSLDADERVTEELRDEILSKVLSPKSEVNGYYIPRKLFFCGRWLRHGGCYPDWQLRLFKKNFGKFNQELVHESVEISGKDSHLKNPLLHFSYKLINQYFERFNTYTTLDAQRRFENGRRFSIFSIFRLPVEFVIRYFIKLGFLDGIPGLFYVLFSSFSSFVKSAKLWEKERTEK